MVENILVKMDHKIIYYSDHFLDTLYLKMAKFVHDYYIIHSNNILAIHKYLMKLTEWKIMYCLYLLKNWIITSLHSSQF